MGISAAAIAAYAGTAAGAATIGAGAAVAGTAYSVYNGEKTRANAKNAANQQAAIAAANKPKDLQSSIDPSKSRAANSTAALAGLPGTLLTGSSGVDPNSLTTGKTLLGG